MELGLRGRVAVVCAASQGLGKATAAAFAREGAHVVICSRNRKRLEAAASEIRAAISDDPVTILPVTADVTKPRQITALMTRTIKEFGRIDILVTNAGGPPVATFANLDDATWEKGIELTLKSTIRLIRAALPHMQKRKWGRIVNITSLSAKQPIADLVVSSTLRPGILGLAKVLATQCGGDGILVNTVAPGYFMTARQQELSTSRAAANGLSVEQYLKDASVDIPLQRYGRPEELADVIVFLASERASYVNGATIGVDGGVVKGLF